MTDPTRSRDRMPSPDEESGSPIDAGTDERLQEEPGQAGPETPGAPSSDKPMTESTDGGLDGGDPGVEE